MPATPLRHALRHLAALALLLGAVGCAGTSRNPFGQADEAGTRISIYVENRGFNDIRLYALTSRGSQALGVVGGNSQRRMNLDWRQMDQISFRIEVLAGRSHNTNALPVSPGDRITLTIPNNPANAFIDIR